MITPAVNSQPLNETPPDASLLSPSLQLARGSGHEAFEVKFLVPEAVAVSIEAWGQRHLDVDPYADPERANSYQTTTVYLDTEQFDIMHQAPGFRGRKLRVRRYGSEETISVERKVRHKDRVRKRRTRVPVTDLGRLGNDEIAPDWPGEWFHTRVLRKKFRPVCCITYDRTAFIKPTDEGTLRLTLDRNIRGAAISHWVPSPVVDGAQILAGQVICELKFRDAMPSLFKQLIAEMQLTPGSVSKYRGMMKALGFLVPSH